MDRITKSYLADFFESQEMTKGTQSSDFERFCNYSIITNEYNKQFDIETVCVGSGADTAIDGIGIIVNGHLIDDIDEIDDLLSRNGYLEATYIFIQSKTSSNFETGKISLFYNGIEDFFSEYSTLPSNDEIKRKREISDHIFSKAADFKGNPQCKSYYVTTGVYNDDDMNISSIEHKHKQAMNESNLFRTVKTLILGAKELGKLYMKTKNPTSTTFTFVNKVTLPEIDGIDQAYYGVLPFSEFKKIIVDENENILSVFDDNVRDFQGIKNSVNRNISDTLSSETPQLFCALNNGVTIVADKIKPSGNNFTIEDYQIVNGCQTSNVLYECKGLNNIDTIMIPLRLIVTEDEEIKSKITVSTNNQTAIKKEQLSAMSDFQKNLEQYYNSIEGEGKLYYERRAKQYNTDRAVIKRRIINVSNQIKTFSSMFFDNPHQVTTYFGKLVSNIGERGSNIFEPDHQYAPYYLAGLTFYRLDSLFNSGYIDKRFRKVKFYITMLVPRIASHSEIPPLNSHSKVEKYCTPIIAQLNTEQQCKEIFEIATKIIVDSKAPIDDKQALKSKAMTEQILASYSNEKSSGAI